MLWLAVFLFCNVAWVFFRAQSFSDAMYVLQNMFAGITSPIAYLSVGLKSMGLTVRRIIYLIFILTTFSIIDYQFYRRDFIQVLKTKNKFVRWTVYIGLVLLFAFFAQKGVAAEFVYFQF